MRTLKTVTNLITLTASTTAGKRPKRGAGRGVTLTELLAAAAASIIVVLSVGFVLADSNRAWYRAYEKAHGDVVIGGFAARRAFDTMTRKACSTGYTLSNLGDWLEVQYYSDTSATDPDRYARFKVVGSSLTLEIGSIDPAMVLDTITICENVSECMFKVEGAGAQMILELDDGVRSTTVVAGGYMHN